MTYRPEDVPDASLLRRLSARLPAGTTRARITLEDTVPGRLAVGALNGAWGDKLDRRHSALARAMTMRRGGRDLALDAAALRSAVPDARARLAVFYPRPG